jgi:hypothetical protein
MSYVYVKVRTTVIKMSQLPCVVKDKKFEIMVNVA